MNQPIKYNIVIIICKYIWDVHQQKGGLRLLNCSELLSKQIWLHEIIPVIFYFCAQSILNKNKISIIISKSNDVFEFFT